MKQASATWKQGTFHLLNYICIFSSYGTEETLRPHYRDRPVNSVCGANRSLLREP
jgi:hypothetical protein